MDFLPAPFDQPYLVRALLELALLAPIAGALGIFVILRRQVFAAHAVGVGALPGLVLAIAAGVPALLGGLVAGGALSILSIRLGSDRRRGDASATTGVLLAGAIGVGALLVSAGVGGAGARIDGLLFGSLLGITDADLIRTGAIAAIAAIVLIGLQRQLAFAAFDADVARASGLRIVRLDLILALVVALVVIVAVEAVGAILASALLVLPAAAALRLTRRIVPALGLAAALALIAGIIGVLIADRWSIPPGAATVLAAAALWPLSVALSHVRSAGRRGAAIAGIAAIGLLSACGGSDTTTTTDTAASASAATAAEGPLSVAATTPIVADWVRAVGGDDVNVTTIIAAGVETHDFEPTPEAARAINDARLVFSSGAGLDEWADQLVEGAGGGVELVELAPEADLMAPASGDAHGHEDEHAGDTEAHEDEQAHEEEQAEEKDAHDHGDVDPHYWHDPALAIKAVDAIAVALSAADPAHADAFAERARAYTDELTALDAELQAVVDAVPEDRRVMVTDHDAFGYLGQHYGIEILGSAIPSTSGAASADAATLAELIELIREHQVPAVFAESTTDPAVAAVLAGETGATLVDGLYADTLGPEDADTGTYVGMMRGNVLLIVEGLRS